jgi:hypothetical protein
MRTATLTITKRKGYAPDFDTEYRWRLSAGFGSFDDENPRDWTCDRVYRGPGGCYHDAIKRAIELGLSIEYLYTEDLTKAGGRPVSAFESDRPAWAVR